MINTSSLSKRSILIVTFIAFAAVAIYFFPLFHVVNIETANEQKEAGKFNAKEFVEKFWNERLPNSFVKATDAAVLLTAIKNAPQDAKKQFSHQLGMGKTYYYFVKGEGRIISVNPDAVGISLEKTGTKPDIILSTSNIFGNTVRDGIGLFNVNDFQSSQEFNQISAELNKRIESEVLPELRTNAKVGATVNFAGTAEIIDEKTDLNPIKLIPIKAQIQ